MLATSIFGIADHFYFGWQSSVIAHSLALAASALAVIAPACGALLLPWRLQYRIVIGLVLALAGFFVYWLSLVIVTAVSGFPIVRFEA